MCISAANYEGSESRVSSMSGVEGEEATLLCGEDSSGGDCSWETPYFRTYSLLPGEYAERGRIQECSQFLSFFLF